MVGADHERGLTPVRVDRVQDLGGLEPSAAAWDALAAAAPQASPLDSHAWIASHLAHRLDPDVRWTCYLAHRDEELVGVLPVIRARHPLVGPLAVDLRVPQDYHTLNGEPVLSPVLSPDQAAETLAALLAAAHHDEPHLASLYFGGMRSESPALGALGSLGVEAHVDIEGRALAIAGTWDDYNAGLSRNFRRNLRRTEARVLAEGRARWHLLVDGDDGLDLLDTFLRLEASGWKGREGSAILCRESSASFYRDVVERFARRGWLEWSLLELDGRPAAAHLGVKLGRRRTLLRIAYDEAFKRDAPGNVLFAEVARRTFETGDVDALDCVTDMDWHDHWALDRYPYQAAMWHPPGVGAWLLGRAPERLTDLGRRVLRGK